MKKSDYQSKEEWLPSPFLTKTSASRSNCGHMLGSLHFYCHKTVVSSQLLYFVCVFIHFTKMSSPKSTIIFSVYQYNLHNISKHECYKYCFTNFLTKYILHSNCLSLFLYSNVIRVPLWSILPITYQPNQMRTGSETHFLWRLLPVFPLWFSLCVFSVFIFCYWIILIPL